MLNSGCEKHSLTHWKLKLCLSLRKCFSGLYAYAIPPKPVHQDEFKHVKQELIEIDREKLNAEITSLQKKINAILEESSKANDCRFMIFPNKKNDLSGNYRIIGMFDYAKYRLSPKK